jgi:hypothetical protein
VWCTLAYTIGNKYILLGFIYKYWVKKKKKKTKQSTELTTTPTRVRISLLYFVLDCHSAFWLTVLVKTIFDVKLSPLLWWQFTRSKV